MGNGLSEDLERQLRVAFNQGLQSTLERWQTIGGHDSRLYSLASSNFWDFCERVGRQNSDGYPLGAKLLRNLLLKESVPRPVRSIVLTAIARWPYEAVCNQSEPLRGQCVAHFARFMLPIVGARAQFFGEWFEDMGDGLPLAADDADAATTHDWLLAPQTTRMLRGLVSMADVRGGEMTEFWQLAAESPRFPVRMFTDPGDYDSWSCFLTPQQMSQTAVFFNHAPEVAVQRFAAAFRDRVLTMQVILYAKVYAAGGVLVELAVCDPATTNPRELFTAQGLNLKYVHKRDIKYRVLVVTDEKRLGLLHAVLSLIQNKERYRLVRGIFNERPRTDPAGSNQEPSI